MWTSIERMGSGLGTSLSSRVHIIHVTALQPLFVHVLVLYISICTVMHPLRLSIILYQISTYQALCSVPTKRCVLCQPNALYCGNQALCTVPTKRYVLCQPNALYSANQALCNVPPKRCVLCQLNAAYCANQALCTVPTKSHVLCRTSADTGQTSAIFIEFLCMVGHTHTSKQKDRLWYLN
jgi:hypothetical protein